MSHARLSEMPEATPVPVEVDGTPVVLVRLGDEVRALEDLCSHQDWALSEGAVYGGSIECSLHGSTFDLATGRPETLPATAPVPTFSVRIDGDDVTVLTD